MRKHALLLMVVLMAGAAFATPVTVTLDVTADSDVRQNSADYAKGDRTWHYLCNTGTASGKVYMRFALPEDFGTAVSATLNVWTGAVLSSSYGSTVNVHGVLDNVSGQQWQDVPHTLTWNNAPANDTSSSLGFTSDATGILGTFDIIGGRYGAAVGDQMSVSAQGIVDFLNDDTDKNINLMLSRVGVSSAYHGIAASEMGSVSGPQIVLTYEPVPEPMTVLLLGFGGLLLKRKK